MSPLRRFLESIFVYGVVIAVFVGLGYGAWRLGRLTGTRSDCLQQYVLPPVDDTLAAWLAWSGTEAVDEYAYLFNKGKLFFGVSVNGNVSAWELCWHGTDPGAPYAEFIGDKP